ncbi:hypothetical protein M0R04_06735 [Candidatus Dojkabacteria bacterium]|jgi:hypothetical protein|nr:hypothetical protein [Candidatus Dojkabacteria bacterium]
MNENLLELGTVAILFLLFIREFFAYLKAKQNNNGTNGNSNGNGSNSVTDKAILKELQTMNSNHLHTIQQVIETGNARLVDVIHGDNNKMIELLGEIKGRLK